MWKDNKIISGFIPAAVLPFLFYVFLVWIDTFLTGAIAIKKILRNDSVFVISVVIVNFILFQLYMFKFQLERASRGIVLATFIYAFLYIILFQVMGIKRIVHF